MLLGKELYMRKPDEDSKSYHQYSWCVNLLVIRRMRCGLNI